jgi:hypothetical protein
MATKKTKKAESLTIEQRVARIERGFAFLAAKLKTHGIHLAPETETNAEPEEREEE